MKNSIANLSVVNEKPRGEYSKSEAREVVRTVRRQSYAKLKNAEQTILATKIVSDNFTHAYLNFIEKIVKSEISVREEVANALGKDPE